MKNKALELMRTGGFPIKSTVLVEVDESLPYMGYTTEKNGQTLIVVSKWAADSEMLLGLLIHELSHVYRIESRHPSHNFEIHNKVYEKVFGNKRMATYKQAIVHNALNSIQDLYADDIFFRVFQQNKINLTDFFLDWIREPVSGKSEKNRWINAGHLVSTAFAQANIERHKLPNTNGKVSLAVKEFLGRYPKAVTLKYNYFKNRMVGVPEEISNEEMKKFLVEYMGKFSELVL